MAWHSTLARGGVAGGYSGGVRPHLHGTPLALLTTILLLVLATPLQSHTRLKASEPAAGAVLQTTPREVRLHFSEPITLTLTRVTLLGPGERPVELEAPVQPEDSPDMVVVRIAESLRPGVYRVEWQTAGRDAHPVRGRFEFTIAEGAGAAVTPGGGGGGGLGGAGTPSDLPVDDAMTGTSPALSGSLGAPGRAASASPGDVARASTQPAPELAEGPNAEPSGVRADTPTGASTAPNPTFSAESPLYAAVRFILFVATFGVTGAVAFRYLVLPRVAQRGRTVGYYLIEEIGVRPARVGEWFGVLLGVGLVARLVAQGYALGGGSFDGAALRAQLTGTVWGWGWWAQAGAAVLAWLGFRWAAHARAGGWVLAGVAVLALGVTTGLSGHAAGLPSGAALALVADAGHILGAGGWLGGLTLLILVGLPAARRVDEPWRGAALAELVNAFSGMALACAALVVTTGGIGALMHVGRLANLMGTGYGRTLILKLALLGVVVGAGAYNFLRVRPVVGEEYGARRLRTSSTLELIGAAAVLAVTAVLVALPTP